MSLSGSGLIFHHCLEMLGQDYKETKTTCVQHPAFFNESKSREVSCQQIELSPDTRLISRHLKMLTSSKYKMVK